MNQIGSCALKADTVTCQAQVRLSGVSNRESSEYSSFWMNPSVLDAGLQLASTCSRAGANIAHLKIPASMAYYASPFLMTGILKCNYFASSYIQENTCSLESNVEVASFAATKSCSLKRVSHKLINAPGAAFYDSSKESLHSQAALNLPVYKVTEMATCVADKSVPAHTIQYSHHNHEPNINNNNNSRKVGYIVRHACSCLGNIQNYSGDMHETKVTGQKEFIGHAVIHGVLQCAERSVIHQFARRVVCMYVD